MDKLNSEIEKYEDKRDRLIVAEDLNARIGVEQEVAECGTQLEIKILKRRSEDRVVRSEGRRRDQMEKICEICQGSGERGQVVGKERKRV